MIVLYLGVGVLSGAFFAAIGLFFGLSILWSLIIYCAAGGLGVLISAAIVFYRARLSEVINPSPDRNSNSASLDRNRIG